MKVITLAMLNRFWKNGILAELAKKADKTTVATASTLGLVKSGTDITVDSSGNVSVNDNSHNHVISNVDGLQSALNGKMPVTRIVSSTVDFNDLDETGIYWIDSGHNNAPTNSDGMLIVMGQELSRTGEEHQYFFPKYDGMVYTRYKFQYHQTTATWTSWKILGLSTSQSTAITEAGTYALDAVQNNASVSGTLANMIKNLSENCPQFISDYKKTRITTSSAKSYTAPEDCLVVCDLVTSGTPFEIMSIKINDIIVYVYQNPTSQAGVQSTTSYILKKGDVIKISAVSSAMHVCVKN